MAINSTNGREGGAKIIRLVASDGARLRPRMTGKAANGGKQQPLNDRDAYDELIGEVNDLRDRLPLTSDARRDLGYLLADLERLRGRLPTS